MNHWLLILGAGVYQVPLIQTAQRLGFHALVTSRAGKFPGVELADRFVPVDTTDIAETVALAKEYQVAGVVTAGSDVAVPTLGAVVDSLGLHGPGYDAATTCSNKVKMKRMLEQAAVPTALFAVVVTLEEAMIAAERISYPVMVKAVDSSGSRGVTRVSAEQYMSQAWNASCDASRSPEILIERCLTGIEFGAQCLVIGSAPVLTLPHNDTVTPPPTCVPIGHSFPALLPAACVTRVANIVVGAVTALGLKDTAVNFDFLWADDEVYVLEVGARIGATCLPELVSGYTGFDAYELLVRIAVGEHPSLPPSKCQPVGALLLRSATTGIVKQIRVPERIRHDPRVLECQIDVTCGDRVSEFHVGPDRVGHIIVREKTAQRAEALALQYADQIGIEVE